VFTARLDVPTDAKGDRIARNAQFLTGTFVRGLDPAAQDGSAAYQALRRLGSRDDFELGRIDLKFVVRVDVLGRPADVWFDLKCPGNDDYGYLEAVVVVQPREGTMPDLNWAISIAELHDKFYEPLVLRGLLGTMEQALRPAKAAKTAKSAGRSKRRTSSR
jgi:hypothetical protein